MASFTSVLGIQFPDPSKHQRTIKSKRSRRGDAREVKRPRAPAALLGSETDAGPLEVWRGKGLRNPSCAKNGCSITADGKGSAPAKDRLPCPSLSARARPAPPGSVHLSAEAEVRPNSRSWDISQTAKAWQSPCLHLILQKITPPLPRTALLLRNLCSKASPWQPSFSHLSLLNS